MIHPLERPLRASLRAFFVHALSVEHPPESVQFLNRSFARHDSRPCHLPIHSFPRSVLKENTMPRISISQTFFRPLAAVVPILATCCLSILPTMATAGTYAACIVRDAYTNLPDYWAPDVAPGYAKSNVPSNDWGVLWTACTQPVYEALMELHCSNNPNPQPVQWAVAIYNSAGLCEYISGTDTCISACGPFGCGLHSCPSVPTLAGLIDNIDSLLADGIFNAGQADALEAKLLAASASIEKGKIQAAKGQINAFINQVQALMTAGILPQAAGQALLDAATQILATL
jgi:hypothetical protein